MAARFFNFNQLLDNFSYYLETKDELKSYILANYSARKEEAVILVRE